MFIYLKIHILGKWSMSLVFLVGIMIVYLGIASMLTIRKNRGHSHQPNYGQSYSYGLIKKHSILILGLGVIIGMLQLLGYLSC